MFFFNVFLFFVIFILYFFLQLFFCAFFCAFFVFFLCFFGAFLCLTFFQITIYLEVMDRGSGIYGLQPMYLEVMYLAKVFPNLLVLSCFKRSC